MFDRIGMIVGPVFDRDMDGIADPRFVLLAQSREFRPSHYELPTEIFMILFFCDGHWTPDNQGCAKPEMTNTLSFVFPNQPRDANCLVSLTFFFFREL